jgi:tubulin monoglycylase TTLL15
MAKKTTKVPIFKRWNKVFLRCFIVALGIFLSFYALEFSKKYSVVVRPKDLEHIEAEPIVATNQTKPRPKYWFYMARGYMWIFFSVDNVLQKLGLEKIEITINKKETIHNDWDLLWSYDYHNEIPIDTAKLRYHQKINHIPGNFVLCLKDNFACNTESKYIPKAFNNTKSLVEFAEKNPNTRFVQKLWSNRGIELKNVSEISFDIFGPGYKYFAQEYIENPLLIDGHKFDFGVYVVITSINPLRIYFYEKNTLIRLCVKKYDPNNYDDVDSYVISDACLFPWDIESLSVYYNNSYTYKEAMNAYFAERGYEMAKVWREVEDCIRSIVLSKEYSYIYWVDY